MLWRTTRSVVVPTKRSFHLRFVVSPRTIRSAPLRPRVFDDGPEALADQDIEGKPPQLTPDRPR